MEWTHFRDPAPWSFHSFIESSNYKVGSLFQALSEIKSGNMIKKTELLSLFWEPTVSRGNKQGRGNSKPPSFSSYFKETFLLLVILCFLLLHQGVLMLLSLPPGCCFFSSCFWMPFCPEIIDREACCGVRFFSSTFCLYFAHSSWITHLLSGLSLLHMYQ